MTQNIIYTFLIIFTFFTSYRIQAQCEVSVNDVYICQNQMATAFLNENTFTIDALNNYTVEIIDFDYDTLFKSVQLELGDDEVLGPFPIGFPFGFYNQIYTHFWVSSNGFISFVEPGTAYNPNTIPNLTGPFSGIFAAWEDWNPNAGGQISFASLPNRMVIQFKDLSSYNCGNEDGFAGNFQIVLHNNNFWIDIRIDQKAECTNSLQGIQNQYGTYALAVEGRNASLWSANQQTVRFKPQNNNNVSWYNSNNQLIFSGSPLVYDAQETEQLTVIFDDNVSCQASDTFTVNLSFPTPNIFSEGQVLLCDLAGYDYQWLFNGEIIEGANSQYYFPTQNGLYSVNLSNDLGCEETSNEYSFNTASTLNHIRSLNSTVYPNPTSKDLFLNIPSSYYQNIEWQLSNTQGQILDKKSFPIQGDYQTKIDLSSYAKGLYFLLVYTTEGAKQHAIILQ